MDALVAKIQEVAAMSAAERLEARTKAVITLAALKAVISVEKETNREVMERSRDAEEDVAPCPTPDALSLNDEEEEVPSSSPAPQDLQSSVLVAPRVSPTVAFRHPPTPPRRPSPVHCPVSPVRRGQVGSPRFRSPRFRSRRSRSPLVNAKRSPHHRRYRRSRSPVVDAVRTVHRRRSKSPRRRSGSPLPRRRSRSPVRVCIVG
jgi:hypothetical protein